MHYSNLVILEREDGLDIEEAVKRAMGPHEEEGGFWDWYQIGGRWSGALSDYDPTEDPANIEECDLCGGTGFRRDNVGEAARATDPTYTCNGCGEYDHETKSWSHGKHGPGKRVKWPTEWRETEYDIVPLSSVKEEDYHFYRVISPYGQRWERERYEPWADTIEGKFVQTPLPPLEWLKREYKDCWAVVVDNHC